MSTICKSPTCILTTVVGSEEEVSWDSADSDPEPYSLSSVDENEGVLSGKAVCDSLGRTLSYMARMDIFASHVPEIYSFFDCEVGFCG